MTPERWREVDRIWHAVLQRPERERAAAVVELCAGQEDLRREVESLLASVAQASVAAFGASPGIAVPAASLVGRQVGPYTVTALLGAGGMGEVYRAHDSTLGRDVALKILPDVWLADTERRMRFEREARVLASLNHPNIAAIYGIQESAPGSAGDEPVRALVLELVEGDTLGDRLAGHPGGLPIDEAVNVALQICTVPFVGTSSRPMMFSSVLLPQPDGPITLTNSPPATSSVIAESATVSMRDVR